MPMKKGEQDHILFSPGLIQANQELRFLLQMTRSTAL
uniref:Uncharacterized protein n=1 Tax=Rubinisphaera brasiliensis (strain ATCC 49424 / DSM 5305 / JCM 21570 / IAM 15109 / NBRC 103401 / IFAM 1448) TaxID=756272 RepID=F0SS88_RUBBR|nr:hypothetical protein Plabr_0472 [Rubinisphaera brasiliensis DSM 5305]